MTLSEETKKRIAEEAANWTDDQYAGKSIEERQDLGAFFTPPELCCRMIEKFDDLDDDILDPCAGGGALLAACIIAGTDPKRIYANELDPEICEKVLRPRLNKLGVPDSNIHIGDALNEDCLKLWSDGYKYADGIVYIDGKRPGKFGKAYVGIDKSKVKILK